MLRRSLFLCLFITLLACNSEEQHRADNMHQGTHDSRGETIIKQAGPLQLSFDITSMKQHIDMMNSMKMDVQHAADASHYVMLTLLDEQKKPVKNAPVKIKLIGPDKTTLTDEAGSDMDTMSQGKMFHYGYGFTPQSKGTYEVIVMLEHNGEVYTSGAYWTHP